MPDSGFREQPQRTIEIRFAAAICDDNEVQALQRNDRFVFRALAGDVKRRQHAQLGVEPYRGGSTERNERAISPMPPNNNTSIISVLNRLVGRK
jgi:hypothetical protein